MSSTIYAAVATLCMITASSQDPLDVEFSACKVIPVKQEFKDLKTCMQNLQGLELAMNGPAQLSIMAAKQFPFTYPEPVLKEASCHRADNI